MPYSPRFKALRTRLLELRKRFLPKRFSKTGTYSAAVLDSARAYRVLVHAEIEHYFEERTLEIVNLAHGLWSTKGRASAPLLACLSNLAGDRIGLPRTLGSKTNVGFILGKAVGQYKASISHNHGIKTENVLQMLLPVGIREIDIDLVWLSTIDAFGTKRGITAHSAAVTHVIDPQDDFNTVKQIISGIEGIDGLLNKVRARIR